ncbi:Inherit from bactNOG: Metal Dependent Phosphohydrolase [Seminavis robusta]|uniref:Inherit from bactNOG: Metal Dependent Phosphohydrolase n=1 Tax=Seminavis robusta TaxID=568900 RepID=A0A9N8E0Q6_9STRA|nr:Inherit from bactNOG: Metal Dependent Phosphohydrolase [Seminavis robusta]|eukprot:Sro533_g161580.1 Inherit from bactNOG: Metal Dependent Phosphohydrolase (269) ;mRNA; f:11471-12277
MVVGTSILAILVAMTAIAVGMFVSSNRLVFGLPIASDTGNDYSEFIKTKDDVLNFYLEKHHRQIGDDFVPYKNHCLRVLAFTKYHLAQKNVHLPPHIYNIVAMALAYHDIALWTDGELNYLEPSVLRMNERVSREMKISKQAEGDEGTGYVPQVVHWASFQNDAEVAKAIIMYHHKFTDYDYQTDETGNQSAAKLVDNMNEIVNAVRKADWADATMGIVRFGLPQELLAKAYETIPEAGFHNVLVGMGPRLSPDNVMGQLEVMKIIKW